MVADQDGLLDGALATAASSFNLIGNSNGTAGAPGAGLTLNGTKTFESSSGVVITAQNLIATIPAGATLAGTIVVAVE